MVKTALSKKIRYLLTALALSLVVLPLGQSQAKLLTRGQGKKKVLLPEQFKGEQRKVFDLYAKKCTSCHPMSRSIAALQTGITPVTGGPFDKQGIKAYVVKMMRKPKSKVTRKDARKLLKFLWRARALAEEKD